MNRLVAFFGLVALIMAASCVMPRSKRPHLGNMAAQCLKDEVPIGPATEGVKTTPDQLQAQLLRRLDFTPEKICGYEIGGDLQITLPPPVDAGRDPE